MQATTEGEGILLSLILAISRDLSESKVSSEGGLKKLQLIGWGRKYPLHRYHSDHTSLDPSHHIKARKGS